MHESFEAFEGHKQAEFGNATDNSIADIAHFETFECF